MAIGEEDFETVKYSKLVKVAEGKSVSKKTYNNIVSPLRCAFDYGYRDHPEKHNPASGLKGFRITKKDRPVVDPFTIAEAVIAAIHRDCRRESHSPCTRHNRWCRVGLDWTGHLVD